MPIRGMSWTALSDTYWGILFTKQCLTVIQVDRFKGDDQSSLATSKGTDI